MNFVKKNWKIIVGVGLFVLLFLLGSMYINYVSSLERENLDLKEKLQIAEDINSRAHSDIEGLSKNLEEYKKEIEFLNNELDKLTESKSFVPKGNVYTMELTAYTPSLDEGGGSGTTASGAPMIVGRTVACNDFPLGTRLYIEGYGERVVEDTGGMGSGVVDILVATKNEAFEIGRRTVQVIVLE